MVWVQVRIALGWNWVRIQVSVKDGKQGMLWVGMGTRNNGNEVRGELGIGIRMHMGIELGMDMH